MLMLFGFLSQKVFRLKPPQGAKSESRPHGITGKKAQTFKAGRRGCGAQFDPATKVVMKDLP